MVIQAFVMYLLYPKLSHFRTFLFIDSYFVASEYVYYLFVILQWPATSFALCFNLYPCLGYCVNERFRILWYQLSSQILDISCQVADQFSEFQNEIQDCWFLTLTRDSNDNDLVTFIKTGHSISDSANTTGVDIPPKCGNPTLSDEQILDIVGYLRTLEQ